jgi:hypothetical protein
MAVADGSGITWWAVASAFGGTIIGSVLGGTYVYAKRGLSVKNCTGETGRAEW